MIQLNFYRPHRYLKIRSFSVLVPRLAMGVTATILMAGLSFSSTVIASEDSDGDGLSDQYEKQIGTEAYLIDTDGDGINDDIEVGKNLKAPLDSDDDKTINALDFDDDNDGLPTILESALDTDKDGLANYIDEDSDNDGINDGIEGGMLGKDENYDMVDDAFDSQHADSIDANGDYVNDLYELPDSDNNGIPDYLDSTPKIVVKKETPEVPEKKVDVSVTKPKAIEITKPVITKSLITQLEITKKHDQNLKEVAEIKKTVITKVKEKKQVKTVTVKVPKRKVVLNQHTDTDNDGLLDSQEIIIGTNPLKRDSDGDKVSDAIEVGIDINSPQDTDADGIMDALDVDDDNDGVLTKNEDVNNDSSPINDDTDENGIPNFLDNDDDGDSRLTIAEGTTLDSDNDGILDFLDKNDGVKNVAVEIVKKEAIPDSPEIVEIAEEKPAQTSEPESTSASAEEELPDVELTEEQEILLLVEESDVKEGSESIVEQSLPDNIVEEGVVKNTPEIKELKLPKTVSIKNKVQEVKKDETGIISWLTSLLPN